jgi:hypothetical protein
MEFGGEDTVLEPVDVDLHERDSERRQRVDHQVVGQRPGSHHLLELALDRLGFGEAYYDGDAARAPLLLQYHGIHP